MNGPQMASFARKFMTAYTATMRPLCEELDMPETAVEILMYFANNPDCNTARDVCRNKFLKSGIVSFHVERLVNEGLLERRTVPEDRRLYRLVCTQAAAPIIERGRALQRQFARAITDGLDDPTLDTLKFCVGTINHNLEQMLCRQDAAPAGRCPADADREETEEKQC